MADVLTPEVSDRICTHMNTDHADAVLLYAKAFGGLKDAIAAQLLAVNPDSMNLLVQTDEHTIPLQIPFDHELQDSEDAHHTLIDMVKQARITLQAE
jgi:putative heme iron utilization protein